MKKVRSSLNLDISLSRAGAPVGVLSLGLACLNAHGNIQSPAGLAVRIAITSYNVPAAVAIYLACTGVGPGQPVVVESGGCPFGFRCVILRHPCGSETITERSVGRSTGVYA